MGCRESTLAVASRKIRTLIQRPGAVLRNYTTLLRRRAAVAPLRCIILLRRWLGRPLLVFECSAGLREHADPLIEWLLVHGRCTLLVAVPDREFETYRAKGLTNSRWGELACIPKSRFARLGCKPAVTVSLSPQAGSSIAASFKRSDTQRIAMPHGLGDKFDYGDLERRDPLADFDVLFLVGSVHREGSLEVYRQKRPQTISRLRFMKIGSPKTDALFRATVRREGVLNGLGLNPALRTVCYAPTYERWASLEQHGTEIIEALADLPVNVIIKLHHVSLSPFQYEWMAREGHGGKDWRRIIGQIESRRPNVKLAPGQDACPYLTASDLLISDVSGVAYEFVLLDRPVVFFDVPKMFDVYGRNGINYWGRQCGDVVTDVSSLGNVVMQNLREPSRKQKERAEWIPRISYSRGDATPRAGRAILALARHPRGCGEIGDDLDLQTRQQPQANLG